MKKRGISLLLVSAMAAGLLAGCGGSGSSTGSGNSGNGNQAEGTTAAGAGDAAAENSGSGDGNGGGAGSDEQVTLRFSWWGGDDRLAATLEVIEQFEALHPNITIEAEYGSSDGYTDKLATQLAAGTAADIIQVDPEAFPQFVSGGADYFLDLNEYDFDFSNFEPSYYQQRVNGCFDGKQYGVPTGIAGPAMLVNQDLADAIGIDFTQQYTWDDLIEWGKKVREYDDSMYLICANKDYIANIVLFNYAKQLTGKALIDENTKEFTLTEENLQEIYSYIQALYDNEVVAPASVMAAYEGDNLQSDPNWIDGKYVCTFSYISTIEVMTAANPDANYSVGMLPVMEGALSNGYASNCPQVIGISNASQHVEEAVMFLEYFYNDETAMETLACTRSVPPTEKARAVCEENGLLSPLLAESANIATEYGGIPNDPYSSVQESKQILMDNVEAVGYGAASPEDAAADTMQLMNNYISSIQ